MASQASQAGSQAQAGTHLPLGEGSKLVASQATQAGRQAVVQAGSPFPSDSASSQAGSEVTTNPTCWGNPFPNRQQPPPSHASSPVTTRSGRHRHSVRQRPPRLPRGTALPPRQTALVPRKATPLLPPNRLPQGSSPEDPNPKWVINLSSKPLTPAQRSVLAKGPNFVVSPQHPPNLEYIIAIEAACTKLSQQDAEELRAEVNRGLRSSQFPKPNLTKAQNLALRELKRDRDCIVLTADKGVAMVIMDRQDYINKANNFINQNTYRSIPRDPTNSIKIKLISILKRIKNQTGLDSNMYKSMYLTGCVPSSSMTSPKIHKPDTPLRAYSV